MACAARPGEAFGDQNRGGELPHSGRFAKFVDDRNTRQRIARVGLPVAFRVGGVRPVGVIEREDFVFLAFAGRYLFPASGGSSLSNTGFTTAAHSL
jgi:hypothetical protein